MLAIFLKPLSFLPLPVLHRLGAALGWLMFYCMPNAKKIAIANIAQSQLAQNNHEINNLAKKSFIELGKAIVETPAIWQKPQAELLGLVKHVHGWHLVAPALQAGRGIIFLTPHMGCFEITSIYYGSHYPTTILYRPPKLKWLQNVMNTGRARTGVNLAQANASGVRKLMQALKRCEAIGILPDQIPKAGDGEWADFFGKPAYTMNLACKLAQKTGATVIMAFGERLENGAGYAIHLKQIDSIASTAQLNAAIASQIAQKPSQYLWSYNRFKVRNHAVKKLA